MRKAFINSKDDKKKGGDELIDYKKKGRDGEVVIYNLTKQTLVFKEMIRNVSANFPRYAIKANESMVITPGKQNTYYRLIIYAIGAIENDASSSSAPPDEKSRRLAIDTKLTIDSDFLSDSSRIFISGDETKGYIIKSTSPPPSSHPSS